ncbi:MAG: WYL domain-containing transcriptional regulator [Succinivibrio sp.]|nr:WYL domain-containing transcriptional regulator [Succinivibrio sp.]
MGAKKPGEVGAVEKIMMLYTLLLVRATPISLNQVAEELNCSKPTALRLISMLESSRYGRVVVEKRGRQHFYSLARPKGGTRLTINAEGLRQLAMCRDFLVHLLPEKQLQLLKHTLREAGALTPADGSEDPVAGSTTEIATSVAKGRIDYSHCQEQYDTLLEAIELQRCCRILYRKDLNGRESEYHFAPQQIMVFHDAFMVSGWMVSAQGQVTARHDQPSTLYLQRMSKVEILLRSAAHLPKAAEFHHGYFGMLHDVSPVPVRVLFSPRCALYVAERSWSCDQKTVRKDDGSLELTMTVNSLRETVGWLMSFGREVKVLEPAALKKALSEELEAMLAAQR